MMWGNCEYKLRRAHLCIPKHYTAPTECIECRQCQILGERMLATVEPHLQATQVYVRCCELKMYVGGPATRTVL